MPLISIDQKSKTIEISNLKTDNSLVFSYFDKLPQDARDEAVTRALYIGVLALNEDRISALLAKTSNTLGAELESLKIMYDMNRELFYSGTQKGIVAESDIAEYLKEYCGQRGFKDEVALTGNAAGTIPKNKTGDICCMLEGDSARIVVECKFDKGINLGHIKDRDIYAPRRDTAWSQLIEARANRDGLASIIVFDRDLASPSVLKEVDNVEFLPEVGFIVIVDTQRNDYRNLGIAYSLARDICLKPAEGELSRDLLCLIVERILRDLRDVSQVENLVRQAAHTLGEILQKSRRSLLSMEFTRDLLNRFLETGSLTSEDVLSLYMAGEPKRKFEAIRESLAEIVALPNPAE
jgi:hypothetical protein